VVRKSPADPVVVVVEDGVSAVLVADVVLAGGVAAEQVAKQVLEIAVPVESTRAR